MSTVGSIDVILRAHDEVTNVLKRAGASIEEFGSLSERASGRLEGFKSVAKTAAGVLLGELAHDALGALTSAAGRAADSFIDYEQTLAKIVAATGLVGEEARKLEAQLRAVSESQTDLGFTAVEAVRGLEALIKAGMSGREAVQALRAALSLARIEGISTDEAAGLLVQTLTMFGLKASEASDALDVLSRAADAGIDTVTGYAEGLSNCGAAAANMGLSLSETLASLVILDRTFGNAAESGTYLNALFKDLIAKSDKLGISLYEADGSMKDLDSIISQIRKKVRAFGDDQEAINKYLSVFDVRAQRAVMSLINYDGSISEVQRSMEEMGSVTDKINAVMNTYAGRLAQARAAQDNASRSLGQMTADLEIAWKTFAAGLGPIGAFADALGPSMFQAAVSGAIMALTQLATTTVIQSKIMSIALHSIPFIGWAAAAVTAITMLYMAWQNNWGGIRDIITGIWERHLKPVFNAISTTVQNLTGIFKPLIDGIAALANWFGNLGKSASQAIGQIDRTADHLGELHKVVGEPPSTGLIESFEYLNKVISEIKGPKLEVPRIPSLEAPTVKVPVEIGALPTLEAGVAGLRPPTRSIAQGPIEIRIDVHDNEINSEIDKVSLARDIGVEVANKLINMGILLGR